MMQLQDNKACTITDAYPQKEYPVPNDEVY